MNICIRLLVWTCFQFFCNIGPVPNVLGNEQRDFQDNCTILYSQQCMKAPISPLLGVYWTSCICGLTVSENALPLSGIISFLPSSHPTSVSLTSLCVVHAVLRLQCSCLSLLRPGFPDVSLSLGLKSVISSAVPSCLCHNSCLCHLQSSVKLTKICVFLKRKNWIFPLFLLLFVC